MNNFQQTVDLRDQANRPKRPASKKIVTPIEKVYQTEADDEPDLQTISRPRIKEPHDGLIKTVLFILAAIVVLATAYYQFFKRPNSVNTTAKSRNWYAVKLVDGTIYYGQVADAKADPVVIKNVYYNYDQAKQAGLPAGQASAAKNQTTTIEETGSIRLVKRGQETQGGDGSMLVYHVNILLMEALRPDSKVLKAIVEYEK